MKVTLLSNYEDNIWRLKGSYKARSSCGAIYFTGVFERNPKMRETLKAYLWAKKQGKARGRKIGWGSIYAARGKLTKFAEMLEELGHSSFATVTFLDVRSIVARLPRVRHSREILNWAIRMFRETSLPYIPQVHPFGALRGVDLIPEKTARQFQPVAPKVLKEILAKCFRYEERLPALLALRASWDATKAAEMGVRNKVVLHAVIRDAQTAGMLMLMAATGERISELMALRRGCLRCEQVEGKAVWGVCGTVFKFHGEEGEEATWTCGPLGRRAVRMLEDIAPGDVLLCKLKNVGGRGEPRSADGICKNLQQWFDAQDWSGIDGRPSKISAHRFRRTLVRNLRAAGASRLAVKDHLKHKSIWMTDYYCGSDFEMRQRLQEGFSAAPKPHEYVQQLQKKEEGQ